MEVSILNRILNFVLSCGWRDYNDFSQELAHKIANLKPRNQEELRALLLAFKSPFFQLNHISKITFSERFLELAILDILKREITLGPLTFIDIFKETGTISVEEGKTLVKLIASLDERVIQDAIQDALRDLNATNQTERAHDSVLEVSDREHPTIIIEGVPISLSPVVKGYKSVAGKTVTLEDVMHQIIRAYNRTNPDYILLVLAKNPADSLISEYVQYGKSVGNEYLVVLCDPVNLARFLRARKII